MLNKTFCIMTRSWLEICINTFLYSFFFTSLERVFFLETEKKFFYKFILSWRRFYLWLLLLLLLSELVWLCGAGLEFASYRDVYWLQLAVAVAVIFYTFFSLSSFIFHLKLSQKYFLINLNKRNEMKNALCKRITQRIP